MTGISNNPGVLKWPMAAEKCRECFYKTGTNCGICIRVCPINKKRNLLHLSNRWVTGHAHWMTPLYVWMDDLLGYLKNRDARLFWEDQN
ncbi:hypothetical protein ACFLZT_06890 [Thermodesulfobacteriota bacterium]